MTDTTRPVPEPLPECDYDYQCPRREILSRLYGIMKAIPDSVFEIDREGRHLFVHANGDTPTDPRRIKGMTLQELLPEDIVEPTMQAIQQVLETGQNMTLDYSIPPAEGSGGPVRHLQAHLGRTPNMTVVAIVRNVSDLVEHQKKLLEANQALTQFTSLVSHDLREPLTGIAGFATLLQNRYEGDLDERGQHFLDRIVEVSKQMEKKLDDLLAFSKAGKETPFEPFPFGAAVEEAKRALVRKIATTGTRIEIVGELPIVHGDRSLIAQVLQNLFSNSIKYRRKDETPHITIEVTSHDLPFWKVAVKDNGIGFDMRHRDKIFGVFQRLYTVEQYPGTGIGLAIARRIIERHGGDIWPWSEPGAGATFYFTLPKPTVDDHGGYPAG